MKLLKSLEELLYELVSWLLFYPITMWRSVVRPLSMMRYAHRELSDAPEDQYEDTLSPPLFLLITLLLSQTLASTLPSAIDLNAVARKLGSVSNVLLTRGVIFGIYPLCMAVTLLRWKKARLTRDTLRPPFYSQCYVTAPFALVLVLGLDFFTMPDGQGVAAGMVAVLGAIAWYAQAQVRWFVYDLDISVVKAICVFGLALMVATIASTIAAILVEIFVSFDAKNMAP